MELTYRKESGYLIPNLTLPAEKAVTLGKYGRLRLNYLKRYRRILYGNLKTTCTLNEHLAEIGQTAMERMERLTKQMAQAEGVTETLKAQDQMKWVGLMNNIRQRAEEIVMREIVFA